MENIRFPKGLLLGQKDIEVLKLHKELEPVLDRLAANVHEMWRNERSCEELWAASGQLTMARCSFLRGDVMAIGPFVLSRIKPYWLTRGLIDPILAKHLKTFAGPNVIADLDEATSLDEQIRRIWGLSV